KQGKQEFILKIGDVIKTININDTCKRLINIGPSLNENWPIQMLWNSYIHSSYRYIIISLLSKFITIPLYILNINSIGTKQPNIISEINIHKEQHEIYCGDTDLNEIAFTFVIQ
ncbi:unnamed protein product, partial [Rotaria magnacalcarata]